ncbi:MAG TPA: hypothetical protein VER38_04920, partial [Candidatus Eisenbacteria bacterium]|nr:hypothetical protein [Candidatus Eisenbacteria bacterium]
MRSHRGCTFIAFVSPLILLAHPATAATNEQSLIAEAGGLLGVLIPETVDSVGHVGTTTSLALDARGNPYIAYRDETNRSLKLATKVRGIWVIETVDPNAGSGEESSFLAANPILVDTHGDPSIAYTATGRTKLLYAVKHGAGWTVEAVDAAGCCVASPSMALDREGDPSIAYTASDSLAWYLKYASMKNGRWTISTVATAPSFIGCSLALDSNGEPRIVYAYQTAPLRFAWRAGQDWAYETADSSAEVNPFGLSIDLDSLGSPYVSYYTLFDKAAVRLASKQSGAWIHETVDSLGVPQIDAEPDLWTSLALGPQGEPGIAYYSTSRSRLRYVFKSGGAWTYMEPDTVFGTGYFASLARDSWGNPCISYFSGL